MKFAASTGTTPLHSDPRMIVLKGFGGPEQLACAPMPGEYLSPGSSQMLVRIVASSVNPIEWKMREGMGAPRWLWRWRIGRQRVLGIDFAGTVAALGENCRGWRNGDAVMGIRPYGGTYADFALVDPARAVVVHRPLGISASSAGVVPWAGLTAFKALGRRSLAGRRVLIVGASGGVGHLAVQIARHCLNAALVVGIAGARNSGFLRACGAHVAIAHDRLADPIDILTYARDWPGSFDLIVDLVGRDAYWTSLAPRLLRPDGLFVAVAVPALHPARAGEDLGTLAALKLLARLSVRRWSGRYRFVGGLMGELCDRRALQRIADWMADGRLVPHIGRSYPLEQVAAAHRACEAGVVTGKIGLSMQA